MFSGIPQPTPFDLRWRMFGIDVRVHPFFWLMAVVLGWSTTNWGLSYLLLWVVLVFVSVLIHELGHVVMGRVFGSDGHIVLYSFGGLAINSSNLRYRWQRILVSLAGPVPQLVLVGILIACLFLLLPEAALHEWVRQKPLLSRGLEMLVLINVFWGLLNLLPILPLDGGKISREVCEGLLGPRGPVAALGISFALSALLAVELLLREYGQGLIPILPGFHDLYMAIFFGLLAASSFQMLQLERNRGQARSQERLPWE